MIGIKETKSDSRGIVSLVLGIIGLVAWFLPILGAPINIIGLVLGIKSLDSARRRMALVGIVTCTIGLVLTVANASIGAYLGATGQHAIVNLLSAGSRQADSYSRDISETNAIFQEDVFSFQYPSNWVEVPSEVIAGCKKGREIEGTKVLFADGISDYNGETLTTWIIVMRIENELLPGGLSDSFFENMKEGQEQVAGLTGIEIKGIKRTEVAGIPAVEVRMWNEKADVSTTTYMIYPSTPGLRYTISLNTMFPDSRKMEKVFDDVLESLEIAE